MLHFSFQYTDLFLVNFHSKCFTFSLYYTNSFSVLAFPAIRSFVWKLTHRSHQTKVLRTLLQHMFHFNFHDTAGISYFFLILSTALFSQCFSFTWQLIHRSHQTKVLKFCILHLNTCFTLSFKMLMEFCISYFLIITTALFSQYFSFMWQLTYRSHRALRLQ